MDGQGTLHRLGAWGKPLWRSGSIYAETIRMSMNEEEEGGEKAEKKAENLHAFSSREHYG